MNTKQISISTIILAAVASTPLLARGSGGGSGRGGAGNGAASGQQIQMWDRLQDCTVIGEMRGARGDPALCDGSGPGQGTPMLDGSGKALNNRGNPNSTGTPLKDGSGKATAPGKGPKDGTGNNPRHPTGS
jgi:hypothetical protein